jgi:hypothetical protein
LVRLTALVIRSPCNAGSDVIRVFRTVEIGNEPIRLVELFEIFHAEAEESPHKCVETTDSSDEHIKRVNDVLFTVVKAIIGHVKLENRFVYEVICIVILVLERVIIRSFCEMGIQLIQVEIGNVMGKLITFVDTSHHRRVEVSVVVEDLNLVLGHLDRNNLSVVVDVIYVQVVGHLLGIVQNVPGKLFSVVRHVIITLDVVTDLEAFSTVPNGDFVVLVRSCIIVNVVVIGVFDGNNPQVCSHATSIVDVTSLWA